MEKVLSGWFIYYTSTFDSVFANSRPDLVAVPFSS